MAGFNWFRRSHDESQTTESESPQTQETVQPTAPESESTAASPQLSPDDYLQWAKAAYQNIQKQQADQTSEPATDTATATEIPATEIPATEAATAPEPQPVAADQVEADTEPDTEPEAHQPETVAAAPASSPDTVSATPDEDVSSITAPFWAKAAAEREARLQRLKETAIAEPVPEPGPSPEQTPDPIADLPDLSDVELDEAFVWSAEVLAAQGRRPDDISVEEITWLNKLRQGLNKTRLGLVNQLKSIVGQGPLNEDAVLEIEALLLQADVGVEATDQVIEALQARMRQETLPPEQAIAYLKSLLRDMLDQPLQGVHNLTFVPEKDVLNIWLMTGVNGAGKTTTIGKLAHIAKKSDYRCLIAAADTFRAAAVEQVKAWGARSEVDVIANPGKNTDPAAVVFDAIAAAQSRGTELLLVDTAGRLQNKKNLMDELSKVRRIVDKKAPDAKVEALLVLDATLGQNGLRQAQVFSEAANLSGVVLTKLDGTAKGGVALAIVQQLGLPIRFIGAGEGIEDLRPFSSYEFVEALLSG